MKHTAIYLRVSTSEQTVDSQTTAIGQWLQTHPDNAANAKTYTDHGLSGKTENRPAFQAMLADIRAGLVDTVVVYKLDRLTRSANSAIRLVLDFEEIDVAFVAVSQPALNLARDVPFRKTILSAFAEIAQIERETIVSRVKAGLDAAKARGTKLGAPVKVNSAIINQVKTLRSNGQSFRAIAQILEISVGSVQRAMAG